MILSHPTGSYSNVLPKTPSDDTSVVYTISNNDPPRSSLNFSQIPSGIGARQRDVPPVNRAALGALVFTTKDNRPSDVVSGNSLFYVGQVLGFDTVATATVTSVDSSIDTQHDQYYVNGEDVGLDSADMASVSAGAAKAQQVILAELGELQRHKDLLGVDAVSYQKTINEATTVISGLDVILSTDSGNVPIQNAKAKAVAAQTQAQSSLDAVVAELNAIPAQVQQKQDQLRALAALVD